MASLALALLPLVSSLCSRAIADRLRHGSGRQKAKEGKGRGQGQRQRQKREPRKRPLGPEVVEVRCFFRDSNPGWKIQSLSLRRFFVSVLTTTLKKHRFADFSRNRSRSCTLYSIARLTKETETLSRHTHRHTDAPTHRTHAHAHAHAHAHHAYCHEPYRRVVVKEKKH